MSKLKLCVLIVGPCVLYGIVMRTQLTLDPEMNLAAVLILSYFALVAAGVVFGIAALVQIVGRVGKKRIQRVTSPAQVEVLDDELDADNAEIIPDESDNTTDGVYQTIISYSRSR